MLCRDEEDDDKQEKSTLPEAHTIYSSASSFVLFRGFPAIGLELVRRSTSSEGETPQRSSLFPRRSRGGGWLK